MRTTLNIDDRLLQEAIRLSGISEKTAVVRAGLEALIARGSARRLAALGGSQPGVRRIRRRRVKPRLPVSKLVDTSVWIDHFRRGEPALIVLLGGEEVECHPFIIGELAWGRCIAAGECCRCFEACRKRRWVAMMRCWRLLIATASRGAESDGLKLIYWLRRCWRGRCCGPAIAACSRLPECWVLARSRKSARRLNVRS